MVLELIKLSHTHLLWGRHCTLDSSPQASSVPLGAAGNTATPDNIYKSESEERYCNSYYHITSSITRSIALQIYLKVLTAAQFTIITL